MLNRFRKSRAPESAEADLPSGLDEQLAEIASLMRQNGTARDPAVARRLLRLRYAAGLQLTAAEGADPQHPAPGARPSSNGSGLPEITREELTPEVLRSGILQGGCLLVRGLIDREEAARLAGGIQTAFVDCAAAGNAGPFTPHYTRFDPGAAFPRLSDDRAWVEMGGGVLAADSPDLMLEVARAFGRLGLSSLIEDYLGEPAVISVNKSTLRKATPEMPGAWHQDGSFMGDVRALNVWLSLSRCGDEAPGLDVVPRRLDHFVPTGTEGTYLESQISQAVVDDTAKETGVLRPIFEPGDALLFDELFLHQTASDPSMPNVRYAIEAWFFGASSFPGDYVPLAS